MRGSQLFAPTLRETPAEAETISHQLMLRAGIMRKAAAGIYTYLPLGHRVLQKISRVVREEMDAKGSQELMLPIVQPAELWHETGRWQDYGDEMFRLQDRHGREFCLGPTHEEIITAVVRADVRSYRQLPLLLYQIQNKYRDEVRPRFGAMRGREFIMKDLYSFDRDAAGLEASYQKMYAAYEQVFARCALDVRVVEADPGAIGGNATHEFMVLADSGEAEIVHCVDCRFAANTEKAECAPPPAVNGPPPADMESVATPDVRTIDGLSAFLDRSSSEMVKTMLYSLDGKPIAALVRGDHELNETKLSRALGTMQVDMLDAPAIQRLTGAPVGFSGPVGLQGATIVADPAVMALRNGVTGANLADTHLLNVNPGRDFEPDLVADIRTARPGDACPRCGSELRGDRGIEVGQIFKLGTKYSESLGATYLDEDGQAHPMIMGCYGIGVSRTMAAVIEQHHDADGISWPVSIAPYHVVVVPVKYEDPRQREVAETLYKELAALGVEVVLDDRAERAGVKFKDADLVGYPLRMTIGPKALQEDSVEIRTRATGEERRVLIAEAAATVRDMLAL